MRSRLVGIVAIVLVLSGLPGANGVRAQNEPDRYDLAAMTLVPSDVGEPGFGFHANAVWSRDEYAAAINRIQQGDDDAGDEVAQTLDAAGWVGTYASRIGVVQEGNPDLFRKVIFVRLTQYADADGAEAGFTLFEAAFAAPGFQLVTNAPPFGDRSALVRYQTRQGGANQRYDELDLAFQTNDLVVELDVWNYTGDAPAVSELAPLVEPLLARIDAGRAGETPGLSARVLRLEDDGVVDVFDFYRERDRQVYPFFDESADVVSAEQQAFSRARIVDMYFLSQTIPAGRPPSPSVINYRITLYHFEQARTAGNWLTTYPRRFVIEPPAGFDDVSIVDGADTFGERSLVLQHNYLVGEVTLHGYTAYILAGDVVAIVALDGPRGVTLEALATLADGQADCLDEGGCSDGVPIPVDLRAEP